MNYLQEKKEKIRNAQRVYLLSTDDEFYDDYEAGRLYIDVENRHFVFVAEEKPFVLNYEFENYELVYDYITGNGENPIISIETDEHYYLFADKEEFDKSLPKLPTAEEIMAMIGEGKSFSTQGEAEI